MTIRLCDWCGKKCDLVATVDFAPIAEAGNVIHRDLCIDCETKMRHFINAKGELEFEEQQ